MKKSIELDLNFYGKNLDGTENKDLHVGQIVAQALYNSQQEHTLKCSSWAFMLFNKEKITLDDADLEVFKNAIKVIQPAVWLDAQIKQAIKEAENDTN